jgi:hypothetical protein
MDQKVTNPLGDNVTRAKALKAVRDGYLFRGPHPAVVLKYKKTVGKHRNARQINRQTVEFFLFRKNFFLLTKLNANVSDL